MDSKNDIRDVPARNLGKLLDWADEPDMIELETPDSAKQNLDRGAPKQGRMKKEDTREKPTLEGQPPSETKNSSEA